ncbi:hypothetical protein F5B20DRAFT_425897 [Whalleya microplaca]|nr:hypothetical protein F5B20DRAFT_425897 [Whalleya microplaca]
MDSSAPKRRKTSPTTNVPVGGSDASSSSGRSTRSSTRRRRPSFASPTKASLARSNPEILRRRSATRAQSSNDAPAASELGNPTGDGSDSQMPASGTGPAAEHAEGVEVNGDAQQRPSAPASQPKSPIRRATGAMALQPRRTPNKPSPRPLPPPSAEDEELINPFRGRVLRRSPPPGVLPTIVPEEPELPPTPTEKGLSDPASVHTSPVGIHNTPSKRPRRSRALAERIKSSPLKQPPLRPPEMELAKKPTRGRRSLETRETTETDNEFALATRPRSTNKKRKYHPARNIPEPDPLIDKKTLRDSLLSEVASLEADLKLATRENERIRQLQQTRRGVPVATAPEDEAGLLDLLRRHALPPEKEAAPDPTQDFLEAALNPIAFLPFGKANPTLPSLFPPQQENPDAADEDQPPLSHHPIPMTAAEELPYLQVFTPLTFTSTISTLPRAADDSDAANPAPLMQKHVISISSTTPPGLFAARIEMTVNSKTLSVADLHVPRQGLDPAAVGELAPFIEKLLVPGGSGSGSSGGGSGNSALTRNISVITWAMGEWVRVATARARFWCALERELGSGDAVAACVRRMRRGAHHHRRRPGRRPATSDEEDGDSDEDGDEEAGKKKHRFTKADLFAHLGRTSLDLDLAGSDAYNTAETPRVRVRWRIEFDWTGEARSRLGVLVGAPARWHGHDAKGTLTDIPGVFDKLIQENRDPMYAVKTVVALLVGEGDG